MFENSIDLFGTVIQLRQGGVAEPSKRPGPSDAGLWTVAAVHADSDQALHSDVWERHPTGHEVLCVLSGAVHVYLRDHGGGTEPVATLTCGQSFIVPAGRWHRLAVSAPGDLLAITPRVDTQHEKTDAAAPAVHLGPAQPRHGVRPSGNASDSAPRRVINCSNPISAHASVKFFAQPT